MPKVPLKVKAALHYAMTLRLLTASRFAPLGRKKAHPMEEANNMGRPKTTALRERKYEVKVRFNEMELSLLKRRSEQANYRQLSPYLRDAGLAHQHGRLTVEERNLIGSLKQDLTDLQRLRNLIAKDARPELLVGLEILLKQLKRRLYDWES